jgi:phenylalanyl-tRNA synthetase alpha chain
MAKETQGVQETLAVLRAEAEGRISHASSTADLSQIEIEYLGRKGKVTEILRRIGELPKEERPAFGQSVNELKNHVAESLAQRQGTVASEEHELKLQEETADVTLPGRLYRLGRKHPLSVTIAQVKQIFIGLGFEVVEGPELEDYKYNFDALNYPEDHPAMDAQMSFYVTDDLLLRTQTTSLQGRVMESRQPPFRICTIGRCFRFDAVDATHSHTFHQVDCFTVDEGISMANLKGTLTQFSSEMFGPDTRVRFRPDFFPFVEPGAEWAISCFVCKGSGCTLCKGSGWIELGGAGMIHPNILERFGIDAERYTGWAFGMGIERMFMLQHGVDDLRLFLENDLRFLEQF